MRYAEFPKFFLFLLLLSLTASAQNFSEIHLKIRGAIENRDYENAALELRNFERTDKKIFALNNYDYLLARTAEKQGDWATATAYYQAVAARDSILREYALWHLSQIFRSTGNLFLEKVYLRKLSLLAPESLLSGAAHERLTRSHFESRDYEAAIESAGNGKRQTGNAEQKNQIPASNLKIADKTAKIEDRELLVLLGQAYLQSGKTNAAVEIFTKLTNDYPNVAQPDDFALAGARALDELGVGKENLGKTAPPLDDAEHFRRAQIYQFNRSFSLARLHYQAIAKTYPTSGYVADALYQTGRGFVQERNFDQAINWFERVQADFPDQPIAKDALSQSAAAYSRVNKPKEAISRYQKYIEKYAGEENIERAYLNMIDVLRDTGANTEALKWTLRTQETFRGKLSEALALFAQARIRIAQNDWANALADLNNLENFGDLGGARVPGGTNKAEVLFLKGLVLENLDRPAEAIDVYLTIPDGRNEYYGGRATEKLKALAGVEKTQSFAAQKTGSLIANIETKNPEAQRKAAQSILRLTENPAVRAKMLEILRKVYAILPEYQKIPNGKLIELGRREILAEPLVNSSNNRSQNLADELLFLGLYDEAAPELEKSRQSAANSEQPATTGNPNTDSAKQVVTNQNPKSKIQNPKSDFDYTLAVLHKRGDRAHRATAYVEPLWRNVPADYEIELIPREQLELLYPAPYADSLLKYAAPRTVDARYVLAIMRQESRFRADVKSNAAARGLMQFISTTSEKIAAGLKKESFQQDELYNPPTAILFGAQYLSDLFVIFPNQPAAVAASYNGGEDNMARWLARGKADDADRYVPEIAFSQSKDYVYKVLASYRVYRMLYDENLKAK